LLLLPSWFTVSDVRKPTLSTGEGALPTLSTGEGALPTPAYPLERWIEPLTQEITTTTISNISNRAAAICMTES
jgi:hypothetical protein